MPFIKVTNPKEISKHLRGLKLMLVAVNDDTNTIVFETETNHYSLVTYIVGHEDHPYLYNVLIITAKT